MNSRHESNKKTFWNSTQDDEVLLRHNIYHGLILLAGFIGFWMWVVSL